MTSEVKRRITRRKYLREYKLAKGCELCGYKKSPAALAFHHRDPDSKKFGFSQMNRCFDKILEEIEKCQVLCHNCHAEIHDSFYDFGDC